MLKADYMHPLTYILFIYTKYHNIMKLNWFKYAKCLLLFYALLVRMTC